MQRKVLVTPRPGGGDVAVAVIDFGDMVRTARVFELAIALAYACQNRPSPADALAAGRAVVAGYAAVQPLTPREAAVLPTCVAALSSPRRRVRVQLYNSIRRTRSTVRMYMQSLQP